MNKNPNCDGAHCTSTRGEVRLLPTGGGSNAILCCDCYLHERSFRNARNRDLAGASKFVTPDWRALQRYSAEGTEARVSK